MAAASSAAATTTSSATSSGIATSTKWTAEQDKLFEKALASFSIEDAAADSNNPKKWEELAAMVPGKSSADVKRHYELLVQDIRNIEAGQIGLPCYTARDALIVKEQQQQQQHSSSNIVESKKSAALASSSSLYSGPGHHHHSNHHHHHHHHANGGSNAASSAAAASAAAAAANASSNNNNNNNNGAGSSCKSKAQEQERRKGIPWTEDEHRLFLLGLEKFGKGDWRSISRNFVVSRTPTQVASHAQKYFIRLNSIHKDKRRTSIHDITSVNGDGRQQTQGPITGQVTAGGAAAGSSSAGAGAAVGQPANPAVYSSVGQPAVGTPVPLTQPVHHGAYAGRPHVSPRPVPGTPLNVPHMAYPMPQPAMHH